MDPFSLRQSGVDSQPSIPVGETLIPGRTIAPICTTGMPAVYPVLPSVYGFLPQQSQQYVAQPVFYPHTLPNVQNRIPFVASVPSNISRMFVPVASVSPGVSPSVLDPTKVLEEQRKLEKERNFQLQQEKLKQFTVAGKKPNLNPDNLIDSMLGNLQTKKNIETSLSLQPSTKMKQISKEEKKTESTSFEEQIVRNESVVFNSDVSSVTNVGISDVAKKDVKELESMMLECSNLNLNVPSKTLKFQKPLVKKTTSSSSHTATFATSNKARDWRNIQGLNEVFTNSKSRFPSWCVKEKVPELYKRIEAIVTNNDLHAPDTNLLFPIMVSSGLSRELLSQIWELVNKSSSRQLTIQELYAALALIALAQVGHPMKSVDILHQLPSCPIPQLSFFNNSSTSQDQKTLIPPPVSEQNFQSNNSDAELQLIHQVKQPTTVSLMNSSQSSIDQKGMEDITQNATDWMPFVGSTITPSDEYDDFKSASPTAKNFAMDTTPLAIPNLDDFDDFKQAPYVKTPEISIPPTVFELSSETPQPSKHQKPTIENTAQDLLSPEKDKYGVFRVLQQSKNTDHWGNFEFSSVPSVDNSTVSSGMKDINKNVYDNFTNVPVAESTDNAISFNANSIIPSESNAIMFKPDSDGIKPHSTNTEHCSIQVDDEFGDFIHASVASVMPSAASGTSSVSTVIEFADFSHFKQSENESATEQLLDDEFGEFTSSVPVSFKTDFGHDFFFHHLKDNVSLAESQSVSSLELGNFDGGGGHSGESKSSLSRQGSIPSLDLKTVGIDETDSEDCFGEIQLSPFVLQNSKSPSPISNAKGSDEGENLSFGLPFQPSILPLTDKYSVIRQEKAKEEDRYVSCWIQCLQSAVNILQNTQKIFNQMSCSSVCNEVLASEEGGNYIKNVIEIYKMICRIGLASKFLGKQTEPIIDILNEANQIWNTLCGFFADSSLMPEELSFDFSSSILKAEPENNVKVCGLCLLSIDLRSKSFKQEECPKLFYGGRNYHSTCANFWVNCVDPLLPALILPQLL